MRMIIRQIMALAALCWALASCSDDTFNREYGEGMGYLRLTLGKVDVDLSSTTRAEADSLPDDLIPQTYDDFMIDIKQGNYSVEGFPKEYSQLSEEGIELKAGAYTITAYYGENEPIQNTPYFAGTSTVEIYPGREAEAKIEAALANAMLVPAVSESLQKHYKNWTLTVKAGESSMKLADNENADGYLFAQDGQSVNAVFEGTNILGKGTSQEWTVISSAAAQTKYVIQCDPDLSISFGLKAVVEHTQDNLGYLNGTKVTLSFDNLSNVPISLITDWKATLVNATGVEVRSYSTTDFTNTEMDVVDNWIYLPQGDYTLKYSYTLDGEKVSEEETGAATITVPQPTFTAEVSAQTSYSVYTSQGAAVANEKDGSGIFDIATTTTISPDILEKYANLLSISYSLNSGESTTPESPIFQNLQWGKHTLTASVSFDGSNVTSSVDCDVTGIPYKGDYTNHSPFDDTKNPWICVGSGEYWGERGYILFEYYFSTSNNCYVFSPAFHLPSSVDISYSTKVAYFTTGLGNPSIDVYIGVSDRTDNPIKDKTTSIKRINSNNNPGDDRFTVITDNTTIGNNYRVCISHDGQKDSNAAQNWLTFKSLEVLYR